MPEPLGQTPAAAGLTSGPPAGEEPAGKPISRFYYGLGLAVQVLLWFLVFLAIVVAVAVGNQLTEFRYVGF